MSVCKCGIRQCTDRCAEVTLRVDGALLAVQDTILIELFVGHHLLLMLLQHICNLHNVECLQETTKPIMMLEPQIQGRVHDSSPLLQAAKAFVIHWLQHCCSFVSFTESWTVMNGRAITAAVTLTATSVATLLHIACVQWVFSLASNSRDRGHNVWSSAHKFAAVLRIGISKSVL